MGGQRRLTFGATGFRVGKRGGAFQHERGVLFNEDSPLLADRYHGLVPGRCIFCNLSPLSWNLWSIGLSEGELQPARRRDRLTVCLNTRRGLRNESGSLWAYLS